MPFPSQAPRPFTRQSIEELNTSQIGCYGLLRGLACVYVGRGDIRERLLDHLRGGNALINQQGPTHYVTFLTSSPEITEKVLIRELNPCCNQKVG